MKRKGKGKVIKISLVCIFIIYVAVIFVKQQLMINSYKNEKEYVQSQIEEENEYNSTLASMIDNVNSKEYIEEVARTKLNMYFPNERVYEDIGK